jgi:hypothetical protein
MLIDLDGLAMESGGRPKSRWRTVGAYTAAGLFLGAVLWFLLELPR